MQSRAAWRAWGCQGKRNSLKSIVWLFAVRLYSAEAILILYHLFSWLPKPTNITWFIAIFLLTLPFCPRGRKPTALFEVTVQSCQSTAGLLRVNWASASAPAPCFERGVVLLGGAPRCWKRGSWTTWRDFFSYFQFQKRMTATQIYKILKHSNLKGFKYCM